jgi:hypothetical protein
MLLSFSKEKSAKMEIFSAMLLGPFEQLEREFGWEGGLYCKKKKISYKYREDARTFN